MYVLWGSEEYLSQLPKYKLEVCFLNNQSRNGENYKLQFVFVSKTQ